MTGTRLSSIPVLDYLRGVAALGVGVFHARVPLWVGWREIAAHPARYSAFDRGTAWLSVPAPFFGSLVMLFFVVSGFCVHPPHARQNTVPLRPYLARRLLRIYPPYLVATVGSLLIASALGVGSASEAKTWLIGACMAENYVPGGEAVLAANPALWSLPVEVELYLAYPVFLLLVRRFGWAWALGTVSSVSLAAALACAQGVSFVRGNFALFWIVWCSGAWIAEKWSAGQLQPPAWGVAGAALASLVVLLLLVIAEHQIGFVSLCAGGFFFWAVWALVARLSSAPIRCLTLHRMLRAGGRWSYSYYLWHFPLLGALGLVWWRCFGAKPANFGVSLVGCLVVLPMVWAFFRAVELPSHRAAKAVACSVASRPRVG